MHHKWLKKYLNWDIQDFETPNLTTITDTTKIEGRKFYDLYNSHRKCVVRNEEHETFRCRYNEGNIDDMLENYLGLSHEN